MCKDAESKERGSADFSTIFDDVFRTMAQKMPFLLIAVINAAFGTDYAENQDFEQLRNEFYESYGKVITDSILRIGDSIYHIECQSQRDGRMALRMLEYDIAIALEHSFLKEDSFTDVRLPRSCVIYIRNHRKLPQYHEVRLHFPDGRYIDYSVPVIQISKYDIDKIFEKGLLLMLPYYILRYEPYLKSKAANELKNKTLFNEYEQMTNQLMRWSELSEKPEMFIDMMGLMREIADYVIPDENRIRERLGEIMGGNILKLRSEELLEDGYNEGHIEGRKEGQIQERKTIALRMFKAGMKLDNIADMVDASADEVRSWIYG